MRWVILILLVILSVLTVFGYAIVLPDDRQDEAIILAYFNAADAPDVHDNVRTLFNDFAQHRGTTPASWAELVADNATTRTDVINDFRAFAATRADVDLENVPMLVWSTDDNPARKIQCQLFREWHLRNYGTPVDIITDPANRQPTKTIVQSLAGAGPDIIESYGPAQIRQFVASGMGLDITDVANERNFGLDTVFDVAHDSMAVDGRQYAYPCNLGYTVMFYHRDMFREAGIPEPTEPWTYEELIAHATTIVDHYRDTKNVRRFGVMGLDGWGMPLIEGTRFYTPDGTVSNYNNQTTVQSFRLLQEMMYDKQVMPTRAEAASAASSGGATMNADAESASASSLFKNKVTAMVREGRWAYKGWAELNRDRAYLPAIERRLAELGDTPSAERDDLLALQESLQREVLDPVPDHQVDLLESILTDADRSRMLDVGVMHVPSVKGVPWYEVGARVAMVNRTSPLRDEAIHFIEYLASEEYNEQINRTFDSICGVPTYCLDENGISGPPRPLPGLEAFDSPVFAEAMEFAEPAQMSPFIGDNIKGILVAPWIERLTNDIVGPAEAARRIEEAVNDRIHANLRRDTQLRELWEQTTGKTFNPDRTMREHFSDDAAGGAQ